MRILIVSEFMPYPFLGGLARHAINLGNHLIELGHTVDILGNGKHGSKKQISELKFNGSVYLNNAINKPRLAARIERYIKLYPVWLHLLIAKGIAKSIMRYASEYDVIHYHGHYPVVANYIPESVNLVVTHHDYSLSCPKKNFLLNDIKPCSVGIDYETCAKCHFGVGDRLRKWLVLESVRKWRAAARIAINRHKHIFVSKRLSDLNLSVLDQLGARIDVIHNFIDCNLIRYHVDNVDRNHSDNKNTKVIIANNIDPLKGIKYFLQEACKNNVLSGNVEITIAGGGVQKNELEADYSGLGVKFLGHISYPKAINAIRDADIYILSSIWEESCSTGVLEGLYLNKDVRALNRGGTPELKEYTSGEKQLKLYQDMHSLVSSLLLEPAYKNNDVYNTGFGCCVSDKVNDLLDVYNR